jgi:sulfoxide reductase heme-binding subunit YedZ
MANRWIVGLKVLVHAACLAPVAWLAWGLYRDLLGADPISYVTHFTGFGALRLLVISLAITPVRKVVAKLSWLIRFRRMLGLYAFFYASLHLLIYVGLFSGFSWSAMVDDLEKRPYIWAGVAGWVMLLPLALTSTTASIRALGGKRWQMLHRLAYLAAIAGVLHYWWIVKKGVLSPVTITVVLGVLLLSRPVLSWLDAQRRARVAVRAPARS